MGYGYDSAPRERSSHTNPTHIYGRGGDGGFDRSFEPNRNFDGGRNRNFDGGNQRGGFQSDNMSGLGENLQKLQWDHKSLVQIQKSFYTEHPDVAALSDQQVLLAMKELDAKVEGALPHPKPVQS